MHWYFGNRAGLDFSSGAAVPLLDGALVTESAATVISDKETGDLLFYTNGRNIWNKEHRLMPGSNEFEENCPSAISQPSLIVPVPGNGHRYYVFSIHFSPPADEHNCDFGYIVDAIEPEYSCELRYSLVDMRLDGGRGDMVPDQKNILLQQSITEKMTAIPHSNGRDYWLLTHAWNSDAFYIRLVTADGISEPDIQHIGSTHESKVYAGKADNSEIRGMMKAAPNGKKLACAVDANQERPFDLFDFNPASGQLSNYVNLGYLEAQYGLSFSPDNSKLYVSCQSPARTVAKDVIRQYDLARDSEEAVIASGQSIIQGNPDTNIPSSALGTGYYDLQIGPDGRIYGTSYHVYNEPNEPQAHTMLVIERPNEPGYSCEVNFKSFDFGSGNVALGLPNFIQSYFNGLEPVVQEPETCIPAVELYPNPTNSTVQVNLKGECVQDLRLQVINAVGQQVIDCIRIDQSDAKISLSGLADGLYLLVFTTPQGKVVKRVVKLQIPN
ncbi:T9SS type A sorting domain-containing protein [Pontibacter ummariensis]|nr:T9SS type A sorting domain-containing protein [Pontibacter ummariensis]